MTPESDRLNLLIELRRFAEAEAAAREMIARDPDAARGYVNLARALHAQNKPEAIDAARDGVRKGPTDAWAVGTLACVLNWFGRVTEARTHAEEAVRLDPHSAWNRSMLANVLFNLNRFRDARRHATDGLALDPLNESLVRWKGWAEHRSGEYDEALRTANAGLVHHPNSHLLLNLIGCVQWTRAEKTWARARVRRHRAADAALREAVRLDPAQPAYRDNLRNNALACRLHLLGTLFVSAFVALVVVPVGAAAALAVWPVSQPRAGCTAILLVVSFLCVAVFANTNEAALAAPLARLGAPAVPLTPQERSDGRSHLCAVAVATVAPYAVLVCVLLWPAG